MIGESLLREQSRNRSRRFLWPVSALVVVGIAVAMWKRSHATGGWTKRELPGFTIELPAGDRDEKLDYVIGYAQVGNIASVSWEPESGATDLESQAKAAIAASPELAGARMKVVEIRRSGATINAVEVSKADGNLWFASVPCGVRRISIISQGSDDKNQLAHVVESVSCHPDPAREEQINTPPLAIDLPKPWSVVATGRYMVTISDRQSALVIQRVVGDERELASAKFSVMGIDVAVGEKHDGRYALVGTNVHGWAWPFTCSGGDVLVLGVAPDEPTAGALAEMVRAKSHCAGPNEIVRFPK
jgi:hypothetical protein